MTAFVIVMLIIDALMIAFNLYLLLNNGYEYFVLSRIVSSIKKVRKIMINNGIIDINNMDEETVRMTRLESEVLSVSYKRLDRLIIIMTFNILAIFFAIFSIIVLSRLI